MHEIDFGNQAWSVVGSNPITEVVIFERNQLYPSAAILHGTLCISFFFQFEPTFTIKKSCRKHGEVGVNNEFVSEFWFQCIGGFENATFLKNFKVFINYLCISKLIYNILNENMSLKFASDFLIQLTIWRNIYFVANWLQNYEYDKHEDVLS